MNSEAGPSAPVRLPSSTSTSKVSLLPSSFGDFKTTTASWTAEPSLLKTEIWDAELSGFALRVEPSGHKTFVARYRAGGGRSGRLRQTVLGRYGNRLLGRKGRPIKVSTLSMDRSRIERHVKPLLGKKAVSDLTLDDMENLQADIASGKTARPRVGKGGMTIGGGSVAGRTLGMLHTILEHAVRRRKITANPA